MISECEAGFYVLSCVNIDNFKVINAQYGTQTGDNVICHISATMQSIWQSGSVWR